MLNYIWAFMIMIGVIYGAMTGNMREVSNAALNSAGEAVSLCITMMGVMALWVGLMEIAQTSGLIARLTKGIQPFVSFMFPGIPKGHAAREYISTNIIANVLGLGWACTPAGLKAMEELAKLEEERGTAGYLPGDGKNGRKMPGTLASMEQGARTKERIARPERCTVVMLTLSSLHVRPGNMIAYRSQYGSVNPAGIIAPAIVATAVSTTVAVVYCKVKDWRRRI